MQLMKTHEEDAVGCEIVVLSLLIMHKKIIILWI